MATMLKCSGCGHLASTGPDTCAHCGASLKTASCVEVGAAEASPESSSGLKQPIASPGKTNPVGGVVGLIVLVILLWWLWGGGVEDKVAADAVAQYGIAKRNGAPLDVCVQAGMVVAAYLQAKDETHYQQWKQTEKEDCAKIGLVR
jgi:hypothetical protein